MRSRPKHLSLITVTLLLSLTSPLQPPGKILGISGAMAAKSAQDSEADRRLLSTESSPQFLIAGSLDSLPAVSEECNPNQAEGFTRNLGKENLKESLQQLQQQLFIHQNTGNRSGEAEIINKIGLIYLCLKDYPKALEWHQRALVLYEEIGDHFREAETIGYIGNTYFKAGQYRQVEDLFRPKLESFRKNGEQEGERFILDVMLGYLQNNWRIQAGFYSQETRVERFHERTLSWQDILEISQLNLFIDQELGDRYHETIDLHSMGWASRNLGQYQHALNFYQQALTNARQLIEQHLEAFLLIDIGLVYSDLAQYDKALNSLQQSLVVLENEAAQGSADLKHFALNQIGLIYKKQRNYERALQFFQQALDATLVTERFVWDGHNILNNRGEVYFEMGQYEQALDSYQKALDYNTRWGDKGLLGDPGANGFIFNNIGLVHVKVGNYTQAMDAYRKALVLFRELNDRPGERTTLSNIGALLEKQNQPELAIVFYKQAVNITEAIRQNLNTLTLEEQKAYTETVADTYRSLADLLLSQGRILEAQQVLELLKVQELRDFTRDTRAGSEISGIATNPTEAEILKIHGTLIALGQKIEECQETQCEEKSRLLDQREVVAKEFEENVRSLEQEIRSRRANDQAFLDPNTLGGNAQEIVSAQPGTVLVYPLVLEDKLWILWAAQGGITKSIEVPQVGLKQLSETVVKFRQLLQNPTSDIAEVKATGKQLYDWLIPESLQKELKENEIQNLVFSLDRVTRYIPMSAVFDGENYLIENYNISTIISANLTQMGDRLPPGTDNTSVLAAGLSDAVADFNPLPHVPQELDAIVRQSP
ncbi:MAG: tetratricopeptide repeat protein, partial [Coleofasciculus sp. S288]|nr:tetratricopeptide repeat protein [Coleofasciculus sp. S288]